MKSISQISFRYLPHKLKTRIYVVKIYKNDNERFYSFLTFYSLSDLREQGKRYLKSSNNIPIQILNYLSPIETRNKILNS